MAAITMAVIIPYQVDLYYDSKFDDDSLKPITGADINQKLLIAFAVWIFGFTVIWLLYSTIQVLLTPGVVESIPIKFDPKSDSGELYDFTFTYEDAPEYLKSPDTVTYYRIGNCVPRTPDDINVDFKKKKSLVVGERTLTKDYLQNVNKNNDRFVL
jgi:hypothetical protein